MIFIASVFEIELFLVSVATALLKLGEVGRGGRGPGSPDILEVPQTKTFADRTMFESVHMLPFNPVLSKDCVGFYMM